MAVVALAAVALVLVAALARAAFGPPPERADPVAAACWLIAGVLLLALVILGAGGNVLELVLNAVAVLALAVAGWWMRGPRDDGDDGGGDEPGVPPVDWGDFDRLREDWSRPPRPRAMR